MAEVALSNGEKTLKVPNHAEELEGRTLSHNGAEAAEDEPPAEEEEEDKKTNGRTGQNKDESTVDFLF